MEAADMAWEAAVYQLKTFAEQRRWKYERNPFSDYDLKIKLKKELDDPKVDGLCIRIESLDEDFLIASEEPSAFTDCEALPQAASVKQCSELDAVRAPR